MDLIDLTSMKKKRTQSLCGLNFVADRHCCWSRGLVSSYAAGAHGAVEQEGCRPHGQNRYPLAIHLQRNKQKFHAKIWVHAIGNKIERVPMDALTHVEGQRQGRVAWLKSSLTMDTASASTYGRRGTR